MFLDKNRTNLLSRNKKNVILSIARKCNFINNLRYFSDINLLEEDVGIRHFMSTFFGENVFDVKKNNDLACIFKYRCEDFHVYEIERNKNVLNLTYVKRKMESDSSSSSSNSRNGNCSTMCEAHICRTKPDEGEKNDEKQNDARGIGKYAYDLRSKDNESLSTQEGGESGRFYASEQLDRENNSGDEKKEWINFILYKVNKDTQEAIREISKISNIPIKDFYYSGFKDKRSVSTQIISTSVMNLVKINNIIENDLRNDKKMKNIKICNVENVSKKIELGAHSGNRFVIVLRNVQNHEKYLRHKLNYIKKYGFINYFGMQRFGIYKNTFNKGKALISRNYKEYIRHVLDPFIFDNKTFYGNFIKDNLTIYLKNACDIYQKNKNATIAFRYLSHKMNKLLKGSNVIPSDESYKGGNVNKYLYSYMTNSEYEAYILLRNLYMCEKNNNTERNRRNISNDNYRNNLRKTNENVEKEKLPNLFQNMFKDPTKKQSNVHFETELNRKEFEEEKYFYKNEKTCVKGVCMETRRFHMHSYSAKIFNMLTSYRLENFGVTLRKGDYVFTKDVQSEVNELKAQHNYITILYDEYDMSHMIEKYHTQPNCLNIYNVVLPVLGSMPYRLSYLNIFKNIYRKYKGQKVRLVFLEILLYLIHTLYEDQLFQIHGDKVINGFLKHLINTKETGHINESIKIASDNILNNIIPIKETLYTIKKFDTYVNSFEYEYGMTCVFRNIVTRPSNLYFCFCQYKEPKRKFLSDLYVSNLEKNKISKKDENTKLCRDEEICTIKKMKNVPHSGNNHKEITICNKQVEESNCDKKLKKYIPCIKRDTCNNYLKEKGEENENTENFQNQTSSHNNSREKITKYEQNFNALILSFSLKSSSYATMLVRELYGKHNELLVPNLIKNCEKYDKEVEMTKREGLQVGKNTKMKN
ncbi:hypothetical protein, conserved [Plasmodium gonderi]|uniref:TRUD domain-containing protein n=1 Tax=Plasmodium gonderi TaxID=77519 RepID=A0A1Y1JCV2_PLAGO|nr:hypothetical protein, conserved [Plasmodium gonderi]GAW79185.1 hypothetical protein, conserved [Plasmodium gonderi]